VLSDQKLASQVFNPRKKYVTHSMQYWIGKHPSKTNDAKAKKVCLVSCFALTTFTGTKPIFSIHVVMKAHRALLKEKWLTLTNEDKEPYAKKAHDHQAKQHLMKECIVDALRKAKGGNCSRSYASLAKVKRRAI
jgi:hypothetical protein